VVVHNWFARIMLFVVKLNEFTFKVKSMYNDPTSRPKNSGLYGQVVVFQKSFMLCNVKLGSQNSGRYRQVVAISSGRYGSCLFVIVKSNIFVWWWMKKRRYYFKNYLKVTIFKYWYWRDKGKKFWKKNLKSTMKSADIIDWV